jgi:rubrerythrin
MDLELPAGAPTTTGEAFAFVGRMGPGTTVDDLKILALVEAIGQELYAAMAEGVEDVRIKDLLLANGREELAHAHRVAEAIEILTGTPFPIPSIDQNPIYTPLAPTSVTKETLARLAQGEFGGEQLYDRIAACFDVPEAVALFRQNGQEELEHGHRLQQAADLLGN